MIIITRNETQHERTKIYGFVYRPLFSELIYAIQTSNFEHSNIERKCEFKMCYANHKFK